MYQSYYYLMNFNWSWNIRLLWYTSNKKLLHIVSQYTSISKPTDIFSVEQFVKKEGQSERYREKVKNIRTQRGSAVVEIALQTPIPNAMESPSSFLHRRLEWSSWQERAPYCMSDYSQVNKLFPIIILLIAVVVVA